MNIVVCVKQVPDTWAERKLKPGDAALDRESVDGLINELDEYAIEAGTSSATCSRSSPSSSRTSASGDEHHGVSQSEPQCGGRSR